MEKQSRARPWQPTLQNSLQFVELIACIGKLPGKPNFLHVWSPEPRQLPPSLAVSGKERFKNNRCYTETKLIGINDLAVGQFLHCKIRIKNAR
jgi:hypothetical protein